MNEQEQALVLSTVGDLELTRRSLLMRVSELERENAALKATLLERDERDRA